MQDPGVAVCRALVGGFGAVLVVPRMLDFYRLSQSGQVTQGEATETHPGNHNTCKYRFMAQGRAYEATGRDCGRASVGEAVKIYFDSRDSSHSTNADPHAALINELVPLVIALVLGPLFVAFGVRRATPHARRG